ncbi:MAG: sugar phosphate nucleotidyltransferase [bacterium]
MTAPPKKAFILAAGLGTRMLPLTRTVPKSLMPIWGRPVLDHVLDLLARWGVREVVVNLHHLPNEVFQHLLQTWSAQACLRLVPAKQASPYMAAPLGAGSTASLPRVARGRRTPRLKIQLSHEPEILGTGGALKKAAWFFDDQPFWMLNADVVADLDPGPLLKAFRPGRTIASAWMHPSSGPRSVEVHRGYVTSWRSRKPGAADTFTFCGLHLVSPAILGYLPDEGPASIITAYEKAMADGHRVAGVCVEDSFWADIGTPEQYLDAHRQVLDRYRAGKPGRQLVERGAVERMERLAKRGVRVSGFAALAEDVTVRRGARITDSVIGSGSTLEAGSAVQNAIVGGGVTVREPVAYIAMRAEDALDAAEQDAVRAAGWNPAQATALPMGPRGSARTFTRIRAGASSAVLVRYKPEREENRLYAGHARFLKRIGVRVPDVLADDAMRCVTLFEDLGDVSVQETIRRLPVTTTKKLYETILDAVLVFHERGTREARRRRLTLVNPFRPALYRWEHDLFADHFLTRRMRLPPKDVALLRRDLGRVGRLLTSAPAVLVHRDLQSSNILLHGGEACFIDFQGMRYGPAVYDLASLLCDPYVELPMMLQDELMAYYAERSRRPAQVRELFWFAAIQRLGQALGAYARLSESAETDFFKKYIPPAMEMMRRAVSRVAGLPHLGRWCDAAARGMGLE